MANLDVRDILDIEVPSSNELTKESILGADKKPRKKYEYKVPKRPEGMHREVFALLCKDNNDVPPLFPTDTGKGYKQAKAKLGMKKVRPWKWTPFTNPARTDDAIFHHWRRVADAGKEYPFAKFNKKVPIPTYTNAEYVQHLVTSGWTRAETDHLFDLCRRFDLRFIVIRDRWDKAKYPTVRSVEDLKERYYQVCAALTKAKSHNDKVYVFDAEHEKRRKEQLKKLFERTPKQVEEEQTLLTELRKIEQRKKERDRKTQDLQKLITAADHQADPRKNERKSSKKNTTTSRRLNKTDTAHISQKIVESAGIKFPDFKNSGVSLRSQRIKLPNNLGQKKMKGIEQMLNELNLELNPSPTEQICQQFNELRSDIVLHYELKSALSTCDYELQALRHQFEALAPGKTLTIPAALLPKPEPEVKPDIIDVVGSPSMSNVSH
ncbi:DNA methyltransferase 1-associated protein 1 isoform X2 [Prorops nasuta]|uniref:DNA methyltransferase 1-associated protein 1 isoform X2 n=1 Tax=Prorops nasuta TaxID=863751 RepID=UPI0034CD527A